MKNEVIEMRPRETVGLVAGEVSRFSVSEIRDRVNLVQQVMQTIMKRDTHYGTIPGTPKPTLYKPGAEQLCVTFRIAQEYRIEDLGDSTTARFRVTCAGRHQVTGIVLGEGVGECSSGEEKYKWRGAVCAQEFEATPESIRHLKFFKNGDKKTQVRTEAADLSNTVLKMACKRAMIAMTLNVTAASDIFTQDIEDLPEELRHQESGEPSLSPLALEWIARASAAKNTAALENVWKEGVKSINEAKDVTASNAFKAVVAERGKDLKAAAASVQSQPVPPELEGLLADLETTADEGEEAFANAWEGLSQATREKLAAYHSALVTRSKKGA